jgi:hypothetical protein
MTEITKATLSQFVVTGEFDIAGSVSADDEAKKNGESVRFTLRFKMNQTPLQDIIQSSLKDKKINWQVKGRDKIGTLKNGQLIVLDYKGGRAPMDALTTIRTLKATMSQAEKDQLIAELQGTK